MFLLKAKDAKTLTEFRQKNKWPIWTKTLQYYPIIITDDNDILWNFLNIEDYKDNFLSNAKIKYANGVNIKKGYGYILEKGKENAEKSLNQHVPDLDKYFAKYVKLGISKMQYYIEFPFDIKDEEDKKFYESFLGLYGYKVTFTEEKGKTMTVIEW